jgi:hypothetical protein
MNVPAPGRVTEDALHVTEDTSLYKGTKERHEGTAVEEGNAETRLVLGVPGGENQEEGQEGAEGEKVEKLKCSTLRVGVGTSCKM